MEQNWTPEPWMEKPACKATAAGIIDVIDVFGADGNRKRIVACVSALAGIPDPAAFVKRAKAIEEAVKLASAAMMGASEALEGIQELREHNDRIEAALALPGGTA